VHSWEPMGRRRTRAPSPGSSEAGVGRQLLSFAVVLLGLSLVFYLVGPVIGSLSRFTRANVPAAALMAVCPACAAVLVARRSGQFADLVEMVTRLPRLLDWSWLVAVLGMPAVIALGALLSGQGGGYTAPGWSALALAVAYVVAAVGEEIGWTAFVLPRLEPVTGELVAGLTIGAVWGLWHVVPYVEAGHTAGWVLGQWVFSVVFRVLLVRLALWQGGSMWPVVAAHASYNLAWSLSPDAGAGYDPWIAAGLTAVLVVITYTLTRTPLDERRSRHA